MGPIGGPPCQSVRYAYRRRVPDDLSHVLWVGGAPGAGKSTVARRLAQCYGLHLYDTDAMMSAHGRRVTAGEAPYLHRFIAMSQDERWANRTPAEMLDTFHWFRGEGFSLIADDLRALPAGTVAEGFRLLPHLVRPLLTDVNRAVWLLPTAEFRRDALASRGSTWELAGKTSDPERALRNLAERDRMFTERLAGETRRLGCRTLHLDRGITADEVFARVSELFRLPRPPGSG
jgi:shikimate kinase